MAIAALGACGGGGGGGSPPPGPPEVAIVDAFPALSFEQPLFLTHAPADDGRLYVATRGGVIHVFDNDPQVASAEVFLDISDRVDRSGGEMGLLGLAFDPGYAQNGTIYVNYTAVAEPMFPNRRTKISSFAPLDGEPLA
ncbi:MAG: PQQ-dependent sugar dehydrogenase, partial [Gammaproteobacteria bacterium]